MDRTIGTWNHESAIECSPFTQESGWANWVTGRGWGRGAAGRETGTREHGNREHGVNGEHGCQGGPGEHGVSGEHGVNGELDGCQGGPGEHGVSGEHGDNGNMESSMSPAAIELSSQALKQRRYNTARIRCTTTCSPLLTPC